LFDYNSKCSEFQQCNIENGFKHIMKNKISLGKQYACIFKTQSYNVVEKENENKIYIDDNKIILLRRLKMRAS